MQSLQRQASCMSGVRQEDALAIDGVNLYERLGFDTFVQLSTNFYNKWALYLLIISHIQENVHLLTNTRCWICTVIESTNHHPENHLLISWPMSSQSLPSSSALLGLHVLISLCKFGGERASLRLLYGFCSNFSCFQSTWLEFSESGNDVN